MLIPMRGIVQCQPATFGITFKTLVSPICDYDHWNLRLAEVLRVFESETRIWWQRSFGTPATAVTVVLWQCITCCQRRFRLTHLPVPVRRLLVAFRVWAAVKLGNLNSGLGSSFKLTLSRKFWFALSTLYLQHQLECRLGIQYSALTSLLLLLISGSQAILTGNFFCHFLIFLERSAANF